MYWKRFDVNHQRDVYESGGALPGTAACVIGPSTYNQLNRQGPRNLD